jgi:hypothetical protein
MMITGRERTQGGYSPHAAQHHSALCVCAVLAPGVAPRLSASQHGEPSATRPVCQSDMMAATPRRPSGQDVGDRPTAAGDRPRERHNMHAATPTERWHPTAVGGSSQKVWHSSRAHSAAGPRGDGTSVVRSAAFASHAPTRAAMPKPCTPTGTGERAAGRARPGRSLQVHRQVTVRRQRRS